MTGERKLIDASIFPRLIVREGGRVVQEIELRGDLGIGRAEDNDLQLMDPKSSRHHARLHAEGESFVLNDLGSANGTWVNGVRVAQPSPLRNGDEIVIGSNRLVLRGRHRARDGTADAQTPEWCLATTDEHGTHPASDNADPAVNETEDQTSSSLSHWAA